MLTSRMHADEVEVDEVLVGRLIAAQVPQWGGLRLAPVGSSGTDNVLYRLGDEMVVRLPRIEWAVGDVAKEQEWLPRLAPSLPLVIPTPLHHGTPGEGYPWPWSVYRWIEGEQPVADGLRDGYQLARDLAEFVAALHKVDAAEGPAATRGVPLDERDGQTRTAIGQLADRIDTDAAIAVWERALEAPVWDGPSVWIHGDLKPDNLLLTQGRLSAVIDFGALGVGDPAADLIVAWNLLTAESRDVLRAALGVDDATWARGRGWALSIALIALPYYWTTNPPLVAGSLRVLHEVLTDVNEEATLI